MGSDGKINTAAGFERDDSLWHGMPRETGPIKGLGVVGGRGGGDVGGVGGVGTLRRRMMMGLYGGRLYSRGGLLSVSHDCVGCAESWVIDDVDGVVVELLHICHSMRISKRSNSEESR